MFKNPNSIIPEEVQAHHNELTQARQAQADTEFALDAQAEKLRLILQYAELVSRTPLERMPILTAYSEKAFRIVGFGLESEAA